MSEITDEFMQSMLAKSATYTVVLLTQGPNYTASGREEIIWEHGRRNFELREAGALAIVGPVHDDTNLCGIGLFTTTPDETDALMRDDPAIVAGVLAFEVHPLRSFPGDALP